MDIIRIQKDVDPLVKHSSIIELLHFIVLQSEELWEKCETGSEAEAVLENIVKAAKAIQELFPRNKVRWHGNSICHEPSVNSIEWLDFDDGWTVTYREAGKIVAASAGLDMNTLIGNIVDWVRRGYKA